MGLGKGDLHEEPDRSIRSWQAALSTLAGALLGSAVTLAVTASPLYRPKALALAVVLAAVVVCVFICPIKFSWWRLISIGVVASGILLLLLLWHPTGLQATEHVDIAPNRSADVLGGEINLFVGDIDSGVMGVFQATGSRSGYPCKWPEAGSGIYQYRTKADGAYRFTVGVDTASVGVNAAQLIGPDLEIGCLPRGVSDSDEVELTSDGVLTSGDLVLTLAHTTTQTFSCSVDYGIWDLEAGELTRFETAPIQQLEPGQEVTFSLPEGLLLELRAQVRRLELQSAAWCVSSGGPAPIDSILYNFDSVVLGPGS